MSENEFDEQASAIAEQVRSKDRADRIAAACRGSGNPVALAWLAENLRLAADSRVVDLGAGLGGPAAWLTDRYGCLAVALEPAAGAASEAQRLFEVPSVIGSAEAAPFVSDSFDVALLLGVVSVLDRPGAAFQEARRLAPALGVLEYCSTGSAAVHAGGSVFPTVGSLVGRATASGWIVRQQAPISVPPPVSWSDAADAVDVEPEPSETEVIDAISEGRIAPHMLVADR